MKVKIRTFFQWSFWWKILAATNNVLYTLLYLLLLLTNNPLELIKGTIKLMTFLPVTFPPPPKLCYSQARTTLPISDDVFMDGDIIG